MKSSSLCLRLSGLLGVVFLALGGGTAWGEVVAVDCVGRATGTGDLVAVCGWTTGTGDFVGVRGWATEGGEVVGSCGIGGNPKTKYVNVRQYRQV